MLNFQKKYVERLALERLMKLNPYKYKDADIEGCERPDIQNTRRSIGVEVTSCDFKQMYIWQKYYGKSLLELFKMEGIKPIRFKEIADFCTGDYAKENMDDYIEEEIYLERSSKLKKLKKYDDFYSLQNQDKLYEKSQLNWEVELDENLNIKSIQASAYWPDLIVEKLKNTLRKKEAKFKNYKKFNENNLYIQVFSASKEEYREFENSTDFGGCCFDYIYILDIWSKDNPIYTIDTRK